MTWGISMENICLEGKTILITGATGFIGYSLIKHLFNITKSVNIIGIDNMNNYYDVNLLE